jgi:hypothetical protein
MAKDWESTLRSWVEPPSDYEDTKRNNTETEIKTALSSSGRLKDVAYKVYAKGSYANNTNVRLDYDVDIAVECTDFYYHDQIGAAADVRKSAAIEAALRPYGKDYGPLDFKNDVEQALVDYFGRTAVTRGNMAMRVREKKTTLPADVVPCCEYRLITDIDLYGRTSHFQGTRIYPDHGAYIHNWPVQQYKKGVEKNTATARRYKRIVRALKRLENALVAARLLDDLPSFLIECLVYNVPNSQFNHISYVADMRGVLATVFNETLNDEGCKDWLEASERKYLFHSTQSWTRRQAHDLADKAWDYMGLE